MTGATIGALILSVLAILACWGDHRLIRKCRWSPNMWQCPVTRIGVPAMALVGAIIGYALEAAVL